MGAMRIRQIVGGWLAGVALISSSACRKTDQMVEVRPGAATLPEKMGPLKVEMKPGPPGEAATESCEGKPDRFIRSANGGATFRGAQVGDGTKIILRHGSGAAAKVDYFFVEDDSLAHFVLSRRQEPLRIEYDELQRCVAHAGGYHRALRLRSASAGAVSYAAWLAEGKRDPSKLEAAKRAFQAYIDAPFAK
jgi:hypothetical protein